MPIARREQDRLSRAPEAVMLIIAALIVAVVGAASYQESRDRAAERAEFLAAGRIHDLTVQLQSALTDAETGQRGFLITGREEYLDPYQRATGALPVLMTQLRSASGARSDLAGRVAALELAVREKLARMVRTIDVRRQKGLPAAQAIVDDDRGRQLMDDVRTRCEEIRAITAHRAATFSAAAEQSADRLGFVSTFGSFVLLGFLGLSAVTIFRGMIHRENLYRQAHANAELLRVTLTSIGDAVISTDRDERITFINPIAARLTGWTPDEAVGTPIQNVFEIVNETTRAAVANPVTRALATGTVVGLANHTVLLARGGGEVPIDDSGAPIRDDKGEIVGSILVFRDISERRAAERQLKESNEQLREFVAAAAHDLRSPLNSSNAIAQVLEARFADRLGDEGKQLVAFITTGLTRMSRFLEDLLSYAQASHFEPAAGERTPVAAALSVAKENLRAEIESARAEIISAELPAVMVSQTHLVQLLQNLIGNALKYRSGAPPRIRVSAERIADRWTIAVEDNGLGIEPRFNGEIFKPFRRLHGSDHPGSGIGLATCQKIVSRYGGLIWVDSEPGRGSTFRLTLPAAGESRAAKR
jgi:PAS domain S-box-containing protein